MRWACYVLCLLGLRPGNSGAQDFAVNAAILAEARVSSVPAQIELKWPQRADVSSYRVVRRDAAGVETTVTVAGVSSGWLDANVQAGLPYEYRIRATRVAGTAPPFAYGNVFSGIELPREESLGRVILVVEDRLWPLLQPELLRWEQDVAASGYSVERLLVQATDSPIQVRAALQERANIWPIGTPGTVFLCGRVPQAYSGNIYPDGHADHRGAWPTDGYYADLDGIWTDNVVNNAAASRVENRNLIGDGKFDQSTLPSVAELMVGRVDLSRLPAFPNSEVELLRRYFHKDHAFRSGALVVARRAVVDDNFATVLQEAPSASGRFGAAALLGSQAVLIQDFVGGTSATSALLGMGFGYGEYRNMIDSCSLTQCVSTPPQVMFSLGFGSYFGDYDNEDNILRAVLATEGCALASAWSGRPQWQLHHLGVGRSLGYAARVSQNATSLAPYNTGYFAKSVHVNLLGDPTLTLFPAPAVNSATVAAGVVHWTANADPARLGFAVYRRQDPTMTWQRQSAEMILTTSWTDPAPTGFDSYIVKSIRLETTGSGTYQNASMGVLATPGFPTVTLTAPRPLTQEYPPQAATVRISRDCPGPALSVNFLPPTGTTTDGNDALSWPLLVTIPEGAFYVDIAVNALADGLPEGTEAMLLHLAPNPDYEIAASEITISFRDHPYEEWCQAHFGTVLNPTRTAPQADPDGDGLTNLLEFGLGTEPLQPSVGVMEAPVQGEGSTCHLRYQRRMGIAGLTWQCETSCDFVHWQTNPANVLETRIAEGGGGGMETMELTLPMDAPRCFMRMRVVTAPNFFP